MKNWKILVLALILALPLPVLAIEAHNGDNVLLASGQSIDGNYYAAGQNVEIYGEVNGDLFLAGNKVVVDSSKINGSVFVAANDIDIKGIVTGSVRAVGQNINISGQVTGNVFTAGQNLFTDKDSTVGGHLTFWGQSASLRGDVNGRVEGSMDALSLSGKVVKDVDVYVAASDRSTGMEITDEAVVGGSILYSGLKEANISEKAEVVGEVHFEKVIPQKKSKPFFSLSKGKSLLFSFFALMVVGMVLLYLWPHFMKRAYHVSRKRPVKTFLKGLLILIVTPIAGVILAITIIGLPLAIILWVLWGVMIYVAKVLAVWILGRFLKDRFFEKRKWSKLSILAFGVGVFLLVGLIPFIGILFTMAIYIMAWGTLTEAKYKD